MITILANIFKFENVTFSLASSKLYSARISPTLFVELAKQVTPVKNEDSPNIINGAYINALLTFLFTEIVIDFMLAPEVRYINKLLRIEDSLFCRLKIRIYAKGTHRGVFYYEFLRKNEVLI